MGYYSHRPWLRHYDYWVPPHLVYPERPLHEILDTTVIDVPDAPATSFFGATLTFQDLKDRSDRFATALGRFGVTKGDRVGIMLPNCPQYIIAAFAILRHGAVVVNINPTYTAREVLTVANDSGIRWLITLDVLAPLALGLKDKTSRGREGHCLARRAFGVDDPGGDSGRNCG
jgi:long-chain acyl-CoA synthetase